MGNVLPEQVEEIIAVMRAWADGAVIEYRRYGAIQWKIVTYPLWNWSDCEYRVRAAADDMVDWSLINPKYRYMARDEDNTFWFYVNEPEIDDELYHQGWTSKGECASGNVLASLINNGKPWDESLIERPEGV